MRFALILLCIVLVLFILCLLGALVMGAIALSALIVEGAITFTIKCAVWIWKYVVSIWGARRKAIGPSMGGSAQQGVPTEAVPVASPVPRDVAGKVEPEAYQVAAPVELALRVRMERVAALGPHVFVEVQGGPRPSSRSPVVYVLTANCVGSGINAFLRRRNSTPGAGEFFRGIYVRNTSAGLDQTWGLLTSIDVDTLYPARGGLQKYTFTCQVFRSGADIALGMPGPVGEPLATASADVELELGEFGYLDLEDWILIREDALATFAKILSNCAVDVDWKWGCLAQWVEMQVLPAPGSSSQGAGSRLLDYLWALHADPSTSSNRSMRLGELASIDFQRECIMIARELIDGELGAVCRQTYQSLIDACPRAYTNGVIPAEVPLPFQKAKPTQHVIRPDDEVSLRDARLKLLLAILRGIRQDDSLKKTPRPATEATKAEEKPPGPTEQMPVPAVPRPVQPEPEPTPLVPLKPFEMHHAVEPSGLYPGGQKVVLRVVGFLPGPEVAKLWVTYRLHDRTHGAPVVRVNAHQGVPRQSDELTGPCLEYLGGWRDAQVAASIELAELQSYSRGTTLLNLEVDIHVRDASGEDKSSGKRLFEFDAIMSNEGHGKARQDRDECFRVMVLLLRACAWTPGGRASVIACQSRALPRLVKEMATFVYGSFTGHTASADEILRDLNDYRPLDLAEYPSIKYASERVRKAALNKYEEVISFRPSPEGEQLLNAIRKALGIPRY